VAALALGAPAGRAGFLAALAAVGGADTVCALEPLPAAAALARRLAAANGVGGRVTVLSAGPAALRTSPSGPFPPAGVNLFISDAWDAFLLGNGADATLAAARAAVGTADPVVVPAAARLWGVGVAAETPPGGSGGGAPAASPSHPLDAFRWGATPVVLNLDTEPHAVLTEPVCVVDVRLDTPEGGGSGRGATGPRPGAPRASTPLAAFPVRAPGRLSAVALWTDLILDEEASLTTAPAYAGVGGVLNFPAPPGGGRAGQAPPPHHPAAAPPAAGGKGGAAVGGGPAPTPAPPPPPHTGQALQYLDRWVCVEVGQAVRLVARAGVGVPGNAAGLRLALRRPPLAGGAAAGDAPEPITGWAPRPPWMEAWGGGDSIENPHVQRVRYGALVRGDWLCRVRAGAAGREVEGGGAGRWGGGGGATVPACFLLSRLRARPRPGGWRGRQRWRATAPERLGGPGSRRCPWLHHRRPARGRSPRRLPVPGPAHRGVRGLGPRPGGTPARGDPGGGGWGVRRGGPPLSGGGWGGWGVVGLRPPRLKQKKKKNAREHSLSLSRPPPFLFSFLHHLTMPKALILVGGFGTRLRPLTLVSDMERRRDGGERARPIEQSKAESASESHPGLPRALSPRARPTRTAPNRRLPTTSEGIGSLSS